MKFNMIVLMTSCEPKYAFSTPGIAPHNAPISIAARKHNGTRIQAERFAKTIPTHAVANAAM